MTRRPSRGHLPALLLASGLVAGLLSGSASAAADPVRGEKLHRACLDCHGTEVYVPPRRKVKTLKVLKREVERWNDHYNPKMTPAEVADVVAWLNRDFYRFPE